MTQEEAHRRARIDLGGIEQTKEKCRDARRVNWIEDFAQDLRFSLRMLQKSPAFALAAILTLALGIGTTVAVFSVVDTIILRPLSYAASTQLVMIDEWTPSVGSIPVNGLHFQEWRRGARRSKSTRLNSSHGYISYAVFCLKKKKNAPPSQNSTA